MTISINAVFPMAAPAAAASAAPAASAPGMVRAADASTTGTGKAGTAGAAGTKASGKTNSTAGAANSDAKTADESSTSTFGALLEEAAAGANGEAAPVDPGAEAIVPPAEGDGTVTDPAISIAEATFAAAFPEAAATAQGAPVVKPVDLAAHKPAAVQPAGTEQDPTPQVAVATVQDGEGKAVKGVAKTKDADGAKSSGEPDARLADAARADAAQQALPVVAQPTAPADPASPTAAAQALLATAAQAGGDGSAASEPAAEGIKVDTVSTLALAATGKGETAKHTAFSPAATASTQGKDADEATTAHTTGNASHEAGATLADTGSTRSETATLSSPVLTQTFAPVASRPAALPYPTSAQAATQTTSVTVQEGQFGSDMGVQIARALDAGGNDLLIKLDPRHMGRIDVRLSFDHDGVLRAVMSADSSTAADMLRRESTDLNRALADAGIRADGQSLRFDTRTGGGQSGQDGSQNGNQRWQGQQGQADSGFADSFGGGDDPVYRSLRSSGHVDLMA